MNDLIIKIIGFNIALTIFYMVYLAIYRKDKAFINRRTFLLCSLLLSLLLPFLPGIWNTTGPAPFVIHYDLDELVITAKKVSTGPFTFSFRTILLFFYLAVSMWLFVKLVLQLIHIVKTVLQAERKNIDGKEYILSKNLHGSSFFYWIFIDPESCSPDELQHICKHEQIHVRQFHSLDRMLVEFLLIFNWFNPLLWFLRTSLIENHEYLADSAVIGEGTDLFHYQLSILNQYIGCATISNQFSSQIKKRIKMLNLNHSKNGRWKIVFLLPVTILALSLFSCMENKDSSLKSTDDTLYTEVEEMAQFNGEEVNAFRKYIQENLNYPPEAIENAAQGKVFVKFVITSTGAIRLPSAEELARIEGLPIDEVVAVGYKPIGEETINDKYIQLLKNEAERVVLSSDGKWTAAKHNGENVNTLYTFPISFVLQ